ncbi:MAG: hypothetical protein DSY86_09630, partial [Marinomonas sp.]
MNLILLAPEQALSDQQYKLSGRQIEHIAKVLKKDHGDKLRVGVLNGLIGDAVLDKSEWRVTIETLENE